MRTFLLAAAIAVAGTPVAAQTAKAPPSDGPHVVLTPAAMKWGPAPPVLPAGAQIAVLDGDPGKAGPFTIRFKFPDGYKTPRTGTRWTRTSPSSRARSGPGWAKCHSRGLHDFPVGSFLKIPARAPHFATAKGQVIVRKPTASARLRLTYVDRRTRRSRRRRQRRWSGGTCVSPRAR